MGMFLFTGILITTVLSCKKAIPENVVTTVNGYVIDNVKNKRLPNATVAIYGCNYTTFKISCAEPITTTTTDANGDFSITFNSNGRSIGFEIKVNYDENYDYTSIVPLKEGKVNTVKIEAREFNYLKTHLIITANPFDTLVSVSSNVRHIFYGQTLDTTIMNRVLPNATNRIIYTAWDKNAGKYRRLIDILQIGSQDTINYSRVLPNVNTFPLN